MRKMVIPLLLSGAVLMTGLLSLHAAPTQTTKPTGIKAIVKFSGDRTLSFLRPGTVRDDMPIPAASQEIKPGQILAKQVDTEEQAQRDSDVFKAEEADPISKEAEVAVKAKEEKKLQALTISGSRPPRK